MRISDIIPEAPKLIPVEQLHTRTLKRFMAIGLESHIDLYEVIAKEYGWYDKFASLFDEGSELPEELTWKRFEHELHERASLSEQKRRARRFSHKMVNDGSIARKFCEVCGEKAEIHHIPGADGQYTPWEIMWLCRKHHQQIHSKTPHCGGTF